MRDKIKANYSRWLFVLPALIIVGALLIYPIFSSSYFSLTTKHLTKPNYKFIGLKNYISILSDSNFYKAFLISIMWTVFSLLGQIAIGFSAALALHRVTRFKGVYSNSACMEMDSKRCIRIYSKFTYESGIYFKPATVFK